MKNGDLGSWNMDPIYVFYIQDRVLQHSLCDIEIFRKSQICAFVIRNLATVLHILAFVMNSFERVVRNYCMGGLGTTCSLYMRFGQWLSGTTRPWNMDPISDMRSWNNAFLHFLCETYIFRRSQICTRLITNWTVTNLHTLCVTRTSHSAYPLQSIRNSFSVQMIIHEYLMRVKWKQKLLSDMFWLGTWLALYFCEISQICYVGVKYLFLYSSGST